MLASIYRLRRADWQALGIRDIYGIHKAVYSLFPQDEGATRDFLFADRGGDWDHREILLLSSRPPTRPPYGVLETKPIPESFLQHSHYGFEVVLNPTKRDSATKKIIPVIGMGELTNWFMGKSEALGFGVDAQSLSVSRIGVIRYQKDQAMCTHGTATFTGRLAVTDRALFIKSFRQGIGRAKAFGFGLLQIVPLQA